MRLTQVGGAVARKLKGEMQTSFTESAVDYTVGLQVTDPFLGYAYDNEEYFADPQQVPFETKYFPDELSGGKWKKQKKWATKRSVGQVKEQVNNLHTKREAIEWRSGLRVTDELQLYVYDGVDYLPNSEAVPFTTGVSFDDARWVQSELLTKKSTKYKIGLVSEIPTLNIAVGNSVTPSGFFVEGDLARHVGFVCKKGTATEITGRIYNTANGNHVVINTDENSINMNWLGANPSRTGAQNSAQVENHLNEVTSASDYTIFVNEDLNLGSTMIERDNTNIITNRRVSLSTSDDYIFMPTCSNFKLSGFKQRDFTARLVYVDTNTERVRNHDYSDIRIDASIANRDVFLYSTAFGGAGWNNITYTKVRGFCSSGGGALIHMDHSSSVDVCSEVYVTKCRSNGYSEVYKSSGSGFASTLELRNTISKDASGMGVTTYHTRGGIVINGITVDGHAKTAYVWCGVAMSSNLKPALITNNTFSNCKDDTKHHITGKPVGHGVIYEQAQKATLSTNCYRGNKGAGYAMGAGCEGTIVSDTAFQNYYGCVICSDAGGTTHTIRDVTLASCNHWGNLMDSVLIGGRVARVTINGGYHKDNCTANSNWQSNPTGTSSVHYDYTHTEVKDGGIKEPNPQLNYINITNTEMGKSALGGSNVNSYAEHSVFINSPDSSSNIFISSDSKLNSLVSEIKVLALAGSRVFIRNNTKLSNTSIPLLEVTGASGKIIVKDGNYDWSGAVVN